jgi:hypothetical protein
MSEGEETEGFAHAWQQPGTQRFIYLNGDIQNFAGTKNK